MPNRVKNHKVANTRLGALCESEAVSLALELAVQKQVARRRPYIITHLLDK